MQTIPRDDYNTVRQLAIHDSTVILISLMHAYSFVIQRCKSTDSIFSPLHASVMKGRLN